MLLYFSGPKKCERVPPAPPAPPSACLFYALLTNLFFDDPALFFLAGSSTSSVYGPKKRKAPPIGAPLAFEPAVQVWPRLHSAAATNPQKQRQVRMRGSAALAGIELLSTAELGKLLQEHLVDP